MQLWPWWLSAIGLAGTALLYAWVTRRPLGVSGLVLTSLSKDAKDDDAALASLDDGALERAMIEATRQQFGEAAAAEAAAHAAHDPMAEGPQVPAALGWGRSVVFLIGSVLGGTLFLVVSGGVAHAGALELVPNGLMPQLFSFLGGTGSFIALAVGGVLVGFGTSMAGGCTSGHGLVGCGRLQPPSLVATAAFFGTGIATAFVLRAITGVSP